MFAISAALAAILVGGASFWAQSSLAQQPVSSCAGPDTLRTCAGGGCVDDACRGDEVCEDGACVYWADAQLEADFELTYDPDDPLTIHGQVRPGGFPRQLARHVRFSFGDDYSAWGETVTHTFAAAGVYPVELEIVLEGYRVLRASRLAIVGSPGPEHEPLDLTVNHIPAYQSGRLRYHTHAGTADDPSDDRELPFSLLVPSYGFTVDVGLLETPEAPVDRTSIIITADQDLGGGAIPAGTNLAGRFGLESDPKLRVPRASWLVGPQEAFPEGEVLVTVFAQTADGASHEQDLRFEVVELPPEKQPFDRPMQWLLRFDMDRFTTSGRTLADGRVSIRTRRGPDGKPDFASELALLGAQGRDSAPGANTVTARGAVGASAVYLAWIEREVASEVYRYFRMDRDGRPTDGIAFQIFTDREPGAPRPETFRPDGAFSMLRVGGSLDGYLGRSYFGVYNESRVDDTGPSVGIASGTILEALGSTAGLTQVFDALKPGVGTPVGDDPLDPVVLAAGFDRYARANDSAANARYDALADVAHFVALALANIIAHEMGHAMGLVPNGAPPEGFFGGRRDVAFLGRHTDSHHADFPGLNLMQSGGNLVSTITTTLDRVHVPAGYDLAALARGYAYENRLAPYELAYLQGRLTYRNFNGATSAGWSSCR